MPSNEGPKGEKGQSGQVQKGKKPPPPPEVNDAPVLDLNGDAPGTWATAYYRAGSPLTKIAPNASIVDADSSNFEGGSLRVGFFAGGTWNDRLGIITDNRVTLQGSDKGGQKVVKVDGVVIGWVKGGTNGADLVIEFKKSATPDKVEVLLEHIGYMNTSNNPVTLPRTVTFTLVDGDGTANGGHDTGVAHATIVYGPNAPNVAPTLTGDLAATATEGGRYTLTMADLGWSDPDDSALGVTFTVSSQVNGTVMVNGVVATTFTGQQLQNGLVRFEHNGSETLAASFSVTVEDGNEDGSAPAAATFNFTINPVNDAPVVACDLAADVAEGGSYTLTTDDLWFLDPDDGPADVTFTAFNLVNGTTKVNGVAATSFTAQQLLDGLVTFEHDGSSSSAASFQVSVEDGNEDASAPVPVTFNLTVTAVNDPPVLTGDLSATVAEGSVYTLTLTDLGWSDQDDTASGVTFTISNPLNGVLKVSGVAATSFTGQQLQNGLVTFEHDGSETTSASFQVMVEDGNGDGSVPVASTFNFAVTPVNDAPALTGDLSATVAEGGAYTLTLADLGWSDADDSASGVTFTASGLVNGTLRVNGVAATSFTGEQLQNGVVTFEHNGSETAAASFQVSVDDGNEDGSAPVASTFNLTVTPVNDAPVLTGDLSATVTEGQSYTLTAADLGWSDSDDNASGVTFTASNPVNGTVQVNGVVATSFTGQQLLDGLVTFEHDGSETAAASFQVSVDDGNEDGSAPVASTFNFTVTPVNDAPVLTGDRSATVSEGGSYTLSAADLGWSDPDDSASGVTFTVSNLVNGTLKVSGVAATSFTGQQLQNGLVTFEHNGSETTSASFDLTVEDGNEDASVPVASTFNFAVTPVNDAPALTGDRSATVLEGGSYTLSAADLGWSDSDDSASGVTFTLSNQVHGALKVNGVAAISFTGDQLLAGLVTFEHDGSETASAAFDIVVEDGNEDGSAPVGSTFNFAVTAVNDAPVLGGDLSATVLEGGSYTLTSADLGWTDPDDSALGVTFSISNPLNGMLKVNGVAATSFSGQELLAGLVSFEHDGSETAMASFQVMVEDGNEDGSAPVAGTFNFTVTPVNDPPALTGDLSAIVLEGGAYTLTAADLGWTDVDDSASGVTFMVSNLVNGTLRVNGTPATSFSGQQLLDGLVSFAHDGSETLAASFQVAVDDGNEDGSAPVASTFNFAVTPVNDAPVLAGDLAATVLEGGSYTLTAADLGWSDPDDSASDVTFTVSNPVNGALRVNGSAATTFTGEQLLAGLVMFEHDGSETATASFQVLVEDGDEDGTAPLGATFNFNVTPVNDAPVLTGDLSAGVLEGGSYILTLADVGWSDPDDSAAEVSFGISNLVNGTVRVNGMAVTSFTGQELLDGLVTFVHDGSETTAASFEVFVEDGDEDASTPVASTFDMAVTPVNDAPVLTGDLLATILTGQSYRLTTADLGWTDPDDNASGVMFTVSNLLNGVIRVNGVIQTSFTGQQLLDGLVRFHHDGSGTSTASFGVVVEDGNEDASAPLMSTLLLNVLSPNIDLSAISPLQGFAIHGGAAGDNAGWSVSFAGDVNGDGIDDVIIGAPGGNAGGFDAGQAYIVFGKTDGFGTVDLAALTAADGVLIHGDDPFDKAGFSVSYAGDVNGDGIDDVIIGNNAGDDAASNAGEAYVVFGQSFASGPVDLGALGSAGFKIMGDSADDWAGYKVSTAGDFNNDGYDDIIISAPQGDDGGNNAGEAYLVFGKASGFSTIDLTTLAPTQGFVIQGDVAFDQLGRSSSAGDVNGDGYDDIIVGAPFGDNGGTDAGEAYVIFGRGSLPGTLVSVGGNPARQVLDLSSFSASDGFIIQGDVILDRAAMSVSAAGDINGDGYADVIVGAPNGGDGGTNAGEAYIVFGKSTELSPFGNIDLTTLSAAQGFIIQGDINGDQAGLAVAAAGDFNGDGYDDLIVGAPTGDNGGVDAGEAYVVFGKASGFGNAVITAGVSRQVIDLTTLSFPDGFIIQGDAAGDNAGWSVSAAGDVNDDGFADLIVGAPYADDGSTDAGAAYIIFGGAHWGV